MHETIHTLLGTLRIVGAASRDDLISGWRTMSYLPLSRLVQAEEAEVWLYRKLREHDLAGAVDPDFLGWLTGRARSISAQNALVDAQIERTVEALSHAAIPHIFLKGAARRLLGGAIPYADARGMMDVDVLVRPGAEGAAWAALRSRGFETVPGGERSPHAMPPLVNDIPFSVQVHFSTSDEVSPTDAWERQASGSEEVIVRTGAARVPNPTELFWHALTHGISHGIDRFNLRTLLDIATIWALDDGVDWDELARRCHDEVVDAREAGIWLGAAAVMAGREKDVCFGRVPIHPLPRLLRWKFTVYGRGLGERPTRKLVREGARAELGHAISRDESGASLIPRLRHRVAAGAARATYATWRRLMA